MTYEFVPKVRCGEGIRNLKAELSVAQRERPSPRRSRLFGAPKE